MYSTSGYHEALLMLLPLYACRSTQHKTQYEKRHSGAEECSPVFHLRESIVGNVEDDGEVHGYHTKASPHTVVNMFPP